MRPVAHPGQNPIRSLDANVEGFRYGTPPSSFEKSIKRNPAAFRQIFISFTSKCGLMMRKSPRRGGAEGSFMRLLWGGGSLLGEMLSEGLEEHPPL